jgi:hypothetical protein
MANFTDFTAAVSIASGDYIEGHLAGEGVDSERKFTALAVGQGAFEHAGQYAELNNETNGTALTISALSSDFTNKVQVLFLTANIVEQGLDANQTTEDVTVGTAGVYFASATLSISGGASDTLSFAIFKNNGATQLTPRSTVKLDASGSVTNAVCSGLVSVVAGETLEIWIQNETTTSSCTIADSAFSVFRVG